MEPPVVLYVEDDAGSRKVMELLLRRQLGLPHLYFFPDSEDFVNRVLSLSPIPTLIFLDIHVRPIDGFTMLQELRQLPAFAGVPIVALTASVMNEEVKRLREAGFDSIIAKPVDVDYFPDMVRRIMSGESFWNVIG